MQEPEATSLLPSPLDTSPDIRILILDDDHQYGEFIGTYLEITGFLYDYADHPDTFWDLLAKKPYHLVLLDYRLGTTTGLEILKLLAERKVNLPVIMMTGEGDERVAAKAIQQGAADYLVKGDNFLPALPGLIMKAIRMSELQISIARSNEQIRYQAFLLNHMRDAVIVWDAGGLITYWNPAAEDLLGWSASEMVGRLVDEGYFPLFLPEFTLPSTEVTGSTASSEAEYQVRTKDGRLIWIAVVTSRLEDSLETQPSGFMQVVRDISRRKEMEAEIRSAQVTLAQSARMAAIGEMASSIAHQINNPLTTIIAESQILKQQLADNLPAVESIDAVIKSGWRAQRVIQELAEFSSAPQEDHQLLDINQTLRQALTLYYPSLQEDKIDVAASLATGLPAVSGDARKFVHLWINLFAQARLYRAPTTPDRITLRTLCEGVHQVKVEIFIHGLSYPSMQIDDIFEPALIPTSNRRGTGMELSICREIVHQAGGQIQAIQEDQSILFSIIFPGVEE
ncbi:MAG TPA: PAS domain S-box protein [Anaerolineaceae bacterium]